MKTSGVAIAALIIAIIAFVGTVANFARVNDLSMRIYELASESRENYIPIVSFDDDVLDYALLTEEQRQAGMYLVRLNDGRVQLLCRNGAWVAMFDADTPVSEVRYVADIQMMKYWAGTSECLEGGGDLFKYTLTNGTRGLYKGVIYWKVVTHQYYDPALADEAGNVVNLYLNDDRKITLYHVMDFIVTPGKNT